MDPLGPSRAAGAPARGCPGDPAPGPGHAVSPGDASQDGPGPLLGRLVPLHSRTQDLTLRGPAVAEATLRRRPLGRARTLLAGGHLRVSTGPSSGFVLDIALPPYEAPTDWRGRRRQSWPTGFAEARLLGSASASPSSDGTTFRGRLVAPATGGSIDVAGLLSLGGGPPELAVFRVALRVTADARTLALTARAVVAWADHDLPLPAGRYGSTLVLQVRADLGSAE